MAPSTEERPDEYLDFADNVDLEAVEAAEREQAHMDEAVLREAKRLVAETESQRIAKVSLSTPTPE